MKNKDNKTKIKTNKGNRRNKIFSSDLICILFSSGLLIPPEIVFYTSWNCAILVSMPVATATAERSFSVMRRVKTYLRATMKTERLSSLALMHVYKHVQIDTKEVINVFADRKLRRLAFLFRV